MNPLDWPAWKYWLLVLLPWVVIFIILGSA